MSVLSGETGLLVSKITDIAPFVGYAQSEEQTERKRLRDVLKKGDVYFNSGDLMRMDKDNFIYFQDRVGDTFRYRAPSLSDHLFTDSLQRMKSYNVLSESMKLWKKQMELVVHQVTKESQ